MGAELLLLLMRMGAAGEIPVPLKNTDQPAAAALISFATAVMTKALLTPPHQDYEIQIWLLVTTDIGTGMAAIET